MWRNERTRIAGLSIFECVLALSVALNVIQARQLVARATPPAGPIVLGAPVGTLRGVDADGMAVTVRHQPGDLPTIVYYFDPACSWCRKNVKSVAALRQQTSGRYRFVAITGAAVDTRSTETLRLSPIWRVDRADLRAYRFSGTPHTLLVSSDGRVLQSWPGAYRGRLHAELERYFHVELPVAAGGE